MTFEWTDENVATLKTLLEKGVSAREIGKLLGGITRNAVIGKAHRLGISSQKTKGASKSKASTSINKNINLNTFISTSESTNKIIPISQRCQWPVGYPGNEDFHFCEEQTILGKPYCKPHCQIAYKRIKE